MKQIKAAFHVSAAKVRQWASMGAPIAVLNSKPGYPSQKGLRYFAYEYQLYDWLKDNKH